MRALFKAFQLGFLLSLTSVALLFMATEAFADGPAGSAGDQAAKFRQLGTDLPTPNIYRSASGAPGPAYWQQQADYVIDAALDEDKKRISASMSVTYTNNSPDPLTYLWLALDQNRFKNGSLARLSEDSASVGVRSATKTKGDSYAYGALRRHQAFQDTDYGFDITKVAYSNGKALDYIINDSMMRLNLDAPLASEDNVTFKIEWDHNIVDHRGAGGRGGWELEADGNHIFALAQWFPRMASYTDYTGWQNKQFLGRGEFTLEFGDYEVNLTVPADHIVSATGVLQNPRRVLTAVQRRRLNNANTDEITFIVTPDEAKDNEKRKASGTKTWQFKAENVRDFAWSSSRKFIWDAMTFEQDDDKNPVVMAMSFYPNEAEPIWSKYSTHAVVHTMDVYNKFAFNYPYPIAQSVNGWERGGMEYPMITFNGYRPTQDEKSGEVTYSRNIKYGLIGVIIHEIGHIYFPMTVNTDERRWTWMDEGINTFLEYMAEYEWEENFPIRSNMQNPLDQITSYMTSENQVPIMTQSDSILQFGSNAYAKPAAALIVLRETVMGRELFDPAFREYATRWKFKRPTPADFFRTMEDASAVDLDWFWRGWFFSTDHVDMGITGVREYQIASQDPDAESGNKRAANLEKYPENIVQRRNREAGITPRVDRFKNLSDFYNDNDKFTVSNKDRNNYTKFLDDLKDWERTAYERALKDGEYLYFIDFENFGGLVSPLPLTLTYMNGTTEELMIPAEIWRRDLTSTSKLIIRKKRIKSIALDPAHQTADADYSNNSFPPVIAPSRLELYKSKSSNSSLMADMLTELRSEEKDGEITETPVPMQQKDLGDPDTPMSPKDKDALRRTLEKLLGKD